MHERNAIAARGLVHEVRRDEDRHVVLAREVGQDLPEAVARDGIDARCRLVQDQNIGRMDHRDRKRQALADAERQRVWQCVDDA